MNPNSENTRSLGVGETLKATDFILMDEDYIPVGREHTGHIITGDELMEFVRISEPDPIEAIAASYNIETDMGIEALKVAIECVALLDRKQRDYGSANISNTGEHGVVTRIADKSARLIQLVLRNVHPANETVEDSYMDTANYGIIGLLLRRGIWK